MSLFSRLRTKAQAASDSERVLAGEESLHSIAVELHRLNQNAGAATQLLGQFVEIAVQNHKLVPQSGDMARVLETITAPLTEMMKLRLSKPAAVTSEAGQRAPATVTKEGNGTRVEQVPEV